MFEREIRDSCFVKRWSIVRTLRDQTVAEHSYLVSMYVNDLCIYLGVPPHLHLAALQYALWHDTRDELMTGDLPGPAKRGLLGVLGPHAKTIWDEKLAEWSNDVFDNLEARSGGKHEPNEALLVRLIVKLADWIDAAAEMATEAQMGNRNAQRHMESQMALAGAAVADIGRYYGVHVNGMPIAFQTGSIEDRIHRLGGLVDRAIIDCYNGESQGPHVIGKTK